MSFNKVVFQWNRDTIKRISFLVILLIGTALRLYKWNGYSLWYDEAQWLFMFFERGFMEAIKPVPWLLQKPPLFKVFLYPWSYVGNGEFTLRLVPFIFGILSILVTYKVGEVVFNYKIGLISSFLVSISPFHIHYSQELTHYTLTMFLALCSIYYLLRCLEKNNVYSWIGFVLFTSLSLYANYVCLLFVITENLFFFISYKRYKHLIKKWLLSQFVIALLCIPWMIMLFEQLYILSIAPIEWVPKGSLAHIFQALRLFNVGYSANSAVHCVASFVFFPLLLVGIFSNLKKERDKIRLLVLWLILPIILSILISFTSTIQPSFTYRNFIFSLPAYYILVASGVIKLGKYSYVPILLFLVLSVSSLHNYYKNIFPYPEHFYRPGVHVRKDNRGSVEYIINNFKKGDIVLHTCHSTSHPYYYYFFSSDKRMRTSRDFIESGEDYFLIQHENEIAKVSKGKKRVWLVFSFWEPQDFFLNPSRSENRIKEWLDVNYKLIEKKEFTGIKLFLYQIVNHF